MFLGVYLQKLRVSSIVANTNHWNRQGPAVSLTIKEEAVRLTFCCSYQGCDGGKEVDDWRWGGGITQHPNLLFCCHNWKRIDSERRDREREISNYPHLCPATMGGSR